MSPRRLTRQESAARTRQRLLDVAERAFLKRGYANTSLDRIAETAGYSKGAVYSNFSGKEDLCGAVLDRHYAAQFQEFAEEFASSEPTLDARLDVFGRWWAKYVSETNWQLLTVEFTFHARQNRQVMRQLAERQRWLRTAIAGVLEQEFARLGLKPPLPFDELVVVLVGTAGGIAVQRSLDPSIRPDLLTDLIRILSTSP